MTLLPLAGSESFSAATEARPPPAPEFAGIHEWSLNCEGLLRNRLKHSYLVRPKREYHSI